MTLALADGTAFDARGTPVARNAALIGAGLDLPVNDRTTVGFSYQGQFASDNRTRSPAP
jgi:subtilase-type serine protease